MTGCAKRTDRIAPLALQSMLDHEPDRVLVVDVRSAGEWRGPGGHVPGAIHVPWPGVEDVAGEQIQPAPGQTVVLVCFTGHRSTWAMDAVREATGAEVVDLDGGMLGWWAQGLPTVRARDEDDPAPPDGDQGAVSSGGGS